MQDIDPKIANIKIWDAFREKMRNYRGISRPANCLLNAGIDTLGELCKRSPSELLNLKLFSKGSLTMVNVLLESYGLSLANEKERLLTRRDEELAETMSIRVQSLDRDMPHLTFEGIRALRTAGFLTVGDICSSTEEEALYALIGDPEINAVVKKALSEMDSLKRSLKKRYVWFGMESKT